jgi:hypothetical protein
LQAASRLTDGESMSVGRDGASDAVAFLKAGVPAVEFGPSGGGHHGPDEWVSIDSLARYPPSARRLRAQRARALPGWTHGGAARRGRRASRERDRPPAPRARHLWRALIAAGADNRPSATAVASAVLLDDRQTCPGVHRGGRTVVDIPEIDAREAGDPRTFLILGSDARYATRSSAQAALGHAHARPRRPDIQADRRDVAPARPEGEDPRRRDRQDQRGLRDRRPAQDGRDGQALFRDATSETSRSTT